MPLIKCGVGSVKLGNDTSASMPSSQRDGNI